MPYRFPYKTLLLLKDKEFSYFVQLGRDPEALSEIYSGGPDYLLLGGGGSRGRKLMIVSRPIKLMLFDEKTDYRNCSALTDAEYMKFYQSVLGGELSIIRFDNLPEEEGISISEEWKNKIMHCSLTFDDGNQIYFGDTWENSPVKIGDNTVLHLSVDSEKNVYEFVEKLSVKGEVTMPAEKNFWGSVYGSLVDQFGVSWGVEFELIK